MAYFRLLLILFTGLGAVQLYSQAAVGTVKTTPESNYFSEQLKALSHDSLEGRETLQPGIAKARKRIIRELASSGVKPHPAFSGYAQAVPFVKTMGPERVSISHPKGKLTADENLVLLSGKEGTVDGGTIFLDSLGDPSALRQVKGKIVVTGVGDGRRNNPMGWMDAAKRKKQLLLEAGAVGLIEIFEPGRFPWGMVRKFVSSDRLTLDSPERILPHCWINSTDTAAIRTLRQNDINLRLSIEGYQTDIRPDYNIIGFLPGTDPSLSREIILFSAHYDHVGIGRPDATGDSIYNGTRDNAVGVATILGLARHFVDHPSPRPLMFVFFTAEEKGLLGSEYFIEHPPVPLSDIRFVFNCDNGGYTDTDMISIVGHHRLTGWDGLDEVLAPAGVRHFENETLAKMLFFQSDNIHFARKGIPAPSVSMGFTDFNQVITTYYHRPSDHYENFDAGYRHRYWHAIELLTEQIVRMPELPFWKEGDDLFETGKALYDR